MTEHYFLFPFGISGNLTPIPNPTQISGTVSYESGFPIGYELANTAPGYLPVPRDQFNQLMFDTTGAIQQIQQTGFPSWITAAANGGVAFQYAQGASVWHNGVPYRSLVSNNTDTPPSANWQVIGSNNLLYFNLATDTGSANHYVIAPNPALGSLLNGAVVQMRPTFANTGACDLTVNSTPTTAIKTLANQDPAAGTIIPTGIYSLVYNSTTGFWVIQNPTPLNFVGDSGSGGRAGLVPAPAAGDAAAGKVLGAAGTWLKILSTTAGANGKIDFEGGVTLQWGTGISSEFYHNAGGLNVFPTAFSGTPYYVNFILTVGSAPPAFTTGTQFTPNVNNISSTQFYAQHQGSGPSKPMLWVAIGPT
jgi:hypothetical protein